jgi:catalytic LigB subunit of aromatic ring-opening dioxygenase
MGEVLGVGTTHVPYLMSAPENLLRFRKMLCGLASTLSGKPFVDPPEALAEMGSDPDAVAREHHRLHWKAFAALREHIQRVRPDAILLIGDDQAQTFLPNNMPPYAIYVGAEVDATPFHATRMPGDAEYVKRTWGVDPTHTYHWPCHAPAATLLRDGLIERGFDIASSDDLNSAHWKHGLPHAHANTQLFLRNDLDQIPIIPLFVNCYGPDLAIFDPAARVDPRRAAAYPAPPASRRLYSMGQAIREILEASPWRVMVCPSSTWSHTWLATRYERMRMDAEGNLAILSALERGEGSVLRDYDSPEIEANGDHELRNWIVAAGAMGSRRLEVTWYRASWVSTGFRVFGVWN